MADTDARLEAAVRKRTKLSEQLGKLQGRREAAVAALAEAEAECRALKLDPDNLDATIESLEAKYEGFVSDLEAKTAAAEAALAPYLE